jgi:hypothetical protein
MKHKTTPLVIRPVLSVRQSKAKNLEVIGGIFPNYPRDEPMAFLLKSHNKRRVVD